jgi:hypothetical protein
MDNLEKRLNLLMVQRRDLKIAIAKSDNFQELNDAFKQLSVVVAEIKQIVSWDIDEEPNPIDCWDGDESDKVPC